MKLFSKYNITICDVTRDVDFGNEDSMSDIEFSPPKHRSNLPLHIDCSDLRFNEREPKCVNSFCNSINTRLKLLENEILTQHKVWDYIQREVDEVKSLIEDCTSTCDSSSLSGHENESDVVDSALESHKTCNSLLWDKIKQAEENVEEKKSLMQILSTDVLKLKNSKKKCKRKTEKANSNIDLILEVTNGLHVLKCDKCKFCSEHIDFREGLLSSVIELIHFSKENYNSCLEENKALKSCLQKIYIKTKRCLLHSQIYVRNTQFQNITLEAENGSFCTDSIYSSFEEFCQHFQNLHEELMQLKNILLAAEENHLDEILQSSHSSDCRCYTYARKREPCLDNDYERSETKFFKDAEKNGCYYEKKIKTLSSSDEPENIDPETMFETNQTFGHADKQLEILRSRIFEAVKVIRDVEVEENDDENLINMVASVAEECSALRQEVGYLRNVRQEKKRAWNKLQCFIMDAERKLKGSNRNTFTLKEVISDLGQVIAMSESSSLDETVSYMYSNQLDWVEKISLGYKGPSCEVVLCDGTGIESHIIEPGYQNNRTENMNVSTQTSIDSYTDQLIKVNEFINAKTMSDIAIQTDSPPCILNVGGTHNFESFQEISREIYVVPEALEESDSYGNSFDDIIQLKDDVNKINHCSESKIDCSSENQQLFPDDDSNCISETELSTSIVPLVGSFPLKLNLSSKDNCGQLSYSNTKKNLPLLKMSDIPFVFRNTQFYSELIGKTSDSFNYLSGSNTFLSLFLNSNLNITHLCNNVFYNMLKENVKSVEIYDEENNWSCVILKPNEFPLSLVSSDKSIKYLPPEFCSGVRKEESSFSTNEIAYNDIEVNINPNLYMCDDIIATSVTDNFSALSSINKVELMPNEEKKDDETIDDDDDTTSFPTAEVDNVIDLQHEKEDTHKEYDTTCTDGNQCDDDSTNFPTADVHNNVIGLQHQKEDTHKEYDTACSDDNQCDFTFQRSETFVQEKPVSVCREGTFIIDSGEKLVSNKSKMCDESLYCTAILTALVSNESKKSEKNYILYEVDDSTKNSMSVLQNVNPFLVSNFESQQPPGKQFILCEATVGEDNLNSQAGASSVSSHIMFFKSNIKEANSSIEKPLDSILGSYPLLPQYLPLENYNFDNFDNFSLAKSCEIYMCNANSCKIENDLESSGFIPKNYFKFKEFFPVDQSNNFLSQENMLCQTVFKQNLIPTFSGSFEENCDINLNITKINHEKDLSEITNVLDVKESFMNKYEKETQTDELQDLSSKEKYILESFSGNTQELDLKSLRELEAKNVLLEQDNITSIEKQSIGESHTICNHSYQEQAIRETSFLDEIEALKDNLNQQNAVLLRLKEELEESNYRLVEKEQLLVILQLEHSRLNSMLIESGVKEIDEKECQADISPNINCEALEKEVHTLRQKNVQHYEKIVHQNNTIQSVKSQLCATISHLKHLKDAATKQLRKQKHLIVKSVKLKQQLHETKTELERKCQELEKKNGILSDQEFHIHEMRVCLDSTIEELNEKARISDTVCTSYKRMDCSTQTDDTKIFSFEESKESCPQNKHDVTLKQHSEELLALKAKFHQLESVLSTKKENRDMGCEKMIKPIDEVRPPPDFKEGNIWKLLTISEQSYLNLMNKLSEALQLSDLKGSSALMHSSWLSCDDLADARRHDHKKILQSLEKMKRNIRYLQDSLNVEPKRQNVENISTDGRKSSLVCHSEEMHFQYLCEVLQRAQESLVKEYSQKRSSHRTVVTAGSGRTSRHTASRERRIPLELKNGKILALLDNKLNNKELLPSKFDYNKMECKAGNSKSQTPS